MLRRAAAILVALASAGCAAPGGAPALTVEAKDYPATFDAALLAARDHRLQPVVTDRDLGIIETAPRNAGSLLEPWRTDNSGIDQSFAQTVNHERRRARIEFLPAGWAAPVPDPSAPVVEAAIPGTDRAEARVDLAREKGPIEMRVWVFVDRAFLPNQRIGDWTLSQMRYARDPLDRQDPQDTTTRSETKWTPIGRDQAYERRLADRIREILAERATAAPAAATTGKPLPAAPAGAADATGTVAASERLR